MIAISPIEPPFVSADPGDPATARAPEIDGFAADGRCTLAGADRSAWACPSFYLAIPACCVLLIAVVIVRLCAGLGRMIR